MTALRILVAGIGLFAVVFWLVAGQGEQAVEVPADPGDPIVSIILPEEISSDAQAGKRMFEATCAACHGVNAVGQQGIAPPLVHVIYEPSHHGDEAFQRAVAVGVRQHHWPFGNMPPVDGLSRGDVEMITAYVRELQRANGIN